MHNNLKIVINSKKLIIISLGGSDVKHLKQIKDKKNIPKRRSLYPASVGTSEFVRKIQISKNIKKDISYLLDNPLKLKKFRDHLRFLKQKLK